MALLKKLHGVERSTAQLELWSGCELIILWTCFFRTRYLFHHVLAQCFLCRLLRFGKGDLSEMTHDFDRLSLGHKPPSWRKLIVAVLRTRTICGHSGARARMWSNLALMWHFKSLRSLWRYTEDLRADAVLPMM